mmetsp:Transcript_79340/g.184122  ORF Transcript_79340/g.184122 Transcript_79340/m.184122 type:complete len:292 (+) Transcript_79340:262-1137(+)
MQTRKEEHECQQGHNRGHACTHGTLGQGGLLGQDDRRHIVLSLRTLKYPVESRRVVANDHVRRSLRGVEHRWATDAKQLTTLADFLFAPVLAELIVRLAERCINRLVLCGQHGWRRLRGRQCRRQRRRLRGRLLWCALFLHAVGRLGRVMVETAVALLGVRPTDTPCGESRSAVVWLRVAAHVSAPTFATPLPLRGRPDLSLCFVAAIGVASLQRVRGARLATKRGVRLTTRCLLGSRPAGTPRGAVSEAIVARSGCGTTVARVTFTTPSVLLVGPRVHLRGAIKNALDLI